MSDDPERAQDHMVGLTVSAVVLACLGSKGKQASGTAH